MMVPNYLQYGHKIDYDPGTAIYSPGGDPGDAPFLYIIAGLVKIEIALAKDSRFPLYLPPDNVFGLVEPLVGCPRLTYAYAMEKCHLYAWSREGFDLASGVSWELALTSINGLTRMLRILNAEFGQHIGLLKGGAS